MNLAVQNEANAASLSDLIDRAAASLVGARTSAEVLDARDLASVAYDAAKKAARLYRAKSAHDDLISVAYRAQADALEIEAGAKRRLADEYDAAQERGEVVGRQGGGDTTVPARNAATAAEVGISRKAIHEARIIRDAETADPGIVRRTVDAAVAEGREPTKASVRQAVLIVARPLSSAPPKRGREAVRIRVREALTGLYGLPSAVEVAQYFRASDDALVVAARLPSVLQWLSEFETAFKDIDNA